MASGSEALGSSVESTEALAEQAARKVLDAPTWIHVLSATPSVDASAVFTGLGRSVRRVRGAKMHTMQALYDEFAAAWQFPTYFGENANAFVECLGDLYDWLPTPEGYVVIVTEPEQLLIDLVTDLGRPAAPLTRLVPMFEACAEDYAEAVPGTDSTARPAVGFDLVLLADADQVDRVVYLWKQAGAPIGD